MASARRDGCVDDDVYSPKSSFERYAAHLREPIRGSAVISATALVGCQNQWNFQMCDACDRLDEEIAHYRKVMSAMTDQLTIDRITALVAELEAKKVALHPERK
jgi:hypothetical protein